MHVPCPNCGEPDSIKLGLSRDEQGVAPYTAQMTSIELVEAECDCDLSADQVEAILDAASKEPFDYEDDCNFEPDY